MSPDPIIQAPDNTQSFNRYSYVWNNPLSYTDPSGYQVCVTTSGGITRCTSGGDTGNGTGDLDSGGGTGGGLGDGFGGGFGGGTGGNPFNDSAFRLMEAIGAAVHNYHATIASNRVAAAQRNATLPSSGPPYNIPCADCPFVPSQPTPLLERVGEGVWHLMQGIPVEGQVITGVKATILLGIAKAGKFTGPLNRVAFGLSRHPGHSRAGILGRFAEHVNAKTYWDLYSNTGDLRLLGSRVLDMMSTSRSIHFNLDGLIGSGNSLRDIARWGAEGIGQGNVTAWEFYQVLKNPSFFNKTTFYLDGKVYPGVSRALIK